MGVSTGVLTGGDGDDTFDLTGLTGVDLTGELTVLGGADDDIALSIGKDTVYGGKGDDNIVATVASGSDSINGDAGDDTISDDLTVEDSVFNGKRRR